MELKDRIIEEASRLFFQNGIKSITMSDIASYLGISKRTLYEVFKDKEELLEVCIDRSSKLASKKKTELVNESENVIDAMMRIYAEHLNDRYKLNKSVVHDLRKYHPRLYQNIEYKQKEDTDTFIPLFEKGVEQGLLRDDIDSEILMWLLKAQFRMLMEDNFFPTGKFSIDKFVEAIILNFTRGIATPEGTKLIDETIKKLKEKSN
ncbi:MAG: TetR/AcrR family transcriptional regulator [Candidatus Azobacteroides sp.]|nr:TetR/AcrR family transcriptional regulator [Candidatus Azobacteroides sp.]